MELDNENNMPQMKDHLEELYKVLKESDAAYGEAVGDVNGRVSAVLDIIDNYDLSLIGFAEAKEINKTISKIIQAVKEGGKERKKPKPAGPRKVKAVKAATTELERPTLPEIRKDISEQTIQKVLISTERVSNDLKPVTEPKLLQKKFPEALGKDINGIFSKLDRLDKVTERNSQTVSRYSKELASAYKEGASDLRDNTAEALNKAARIKDSATQEDAVTKISKELSGRIRIAKEGQEERIKLLQDPESSVKQSPAELVKLDPSFLPSGANKQEMKLLAENKSLYVVTSTLSGKSVQVESLLNTYFPPNETDPPKDAINFMNKWQKGEIEKNARGESEYMRQLYVVVTDKAAEGPAEKEKVLGVLQGTFAANEKANVFFTENIVVREGQRKNHLATLLTAAATQAANEYAKDAEQRLKEKGAPVDYPTGKNGEKLMCGFHENEFLSQRPSEIADTFGRGIFHGKCDAMADPAMNYLQPDPLEGGKYDPKTYSPLPLMASFREIGGKKLSMQDEVNIVDLVLDAYIKGSYNAEGVEACREKIKESVGAVDTKVSNLVPFPKKPDEIPEFISKMGGEADTVYRSRFSDNPWTKEWFSKSERPVSIEEALARFERGDKETPPDT